MRSIILSLVLSICLFNCEKDEVSTLSGKYSMQVSGMKNSTEGFIEIIEEVDDCFGRIVFQGDRVRTYEIGLKNKTSDSIHFFLPGNAGFLKLRSSSDSIWGDFKYFGLKAEIKGIRISEPSTELKDLLHLKPLGTGIISTEKEESFPSFESNSNVLYFTRDQKIYFSEFVNNEWAEPKIIDFSGEFNDSAPRVFNEGLSMIFSSNRPMPDSENKKKNLWRSNRVQGKWSSPYPLPSPINIDSLGDYHGGISKMNNIYFVSYNREGGFGRSDIYSARKNETGEFEVVNLGSQINTEKSEADVFISSDESYLLFASTDRDDSYGVDDIYISYNQNGVWSEPLNLGPKVNSFAYEYGPWVDEQNGFLYFNSYRRGSSDIYRIKLVELGLELK